MGRVIILDKKSRSDSEELEIMLSEGIIQGPVESRSFAAESVIFPSAARKKCDKQAMKWAQEQGHHLAYCVFQISSAFFATRQYDFYRTN